MTRVTVRCKGARELRQLAALQYGRDSLQFKKADAKCLAAACKAEIEAKR